ncbi:hypothetical protein TIFTF001_031088 [Ficus carica]|uniref:Uncharacterized protein n=1 Tax=Ficus carica TaxID=3494 RepID=A0AA88DUM1_FICCA|nr:hypothetical protein TIFTF001_031088 [Ficus carica]
MSETPDIIQIVEEQNLAIGVKTRVNNIVHVEVEVVKLHAVGVRFRNVNGRRNAIGVLVGFFLDDFKDQEWVPIGQLTVEHRHTHGFGVVLSSILDRASVLFHRSVVVTQEERRCDSMIAEIANSRNFSSALATSVGEITDATIAISGLATTSMKFPDLFTLLLSVAPVATDRHCRTQIVPTVTTSLAGSAGSNAKN